MPFIKFDDVFDQEEIRKELPRDTDDVTPYYDTTKNPAVQDKTKNLVSNHIDELGKGIKQLNGTMGYYYNIEDISGTDKYEKNIEKLISLFYLFPFSNSKIHSRKSTSTAIFSAPIKDGIGDKIMYFDKPDGKAGQIGTISAKNDKTYTIKLGSNTKSSVQKNQLIFLERTTDGETSDYLDEAVYKKYIEIHGIKVADLLKDLKKLSFKEAEKKYVQFVDKTDFGDIAAAYASNRFSTISKNNSTEPPSVSPTTSVSTSGSPGSPASPATPATPATPKKLIMKCTLGPNAPGAGGRRRRRKTLKKRNTMKNRKTLKKRKATRRRKSTKKRKKRKTTKTKRVKFIL